LAAIPQVERARKSALLRWWQWGTVLMLLVIGTINYLDRSTLPHPTKSALLSCSSDFALTCG
jgi:hypothetical protein